MRIRAIIAGLLVALALPASAAVGAEAPPAPTVTPAVTPVVTPVVTPAVAPGVTPALSLEEALRVANANNPGLRLARYQVAAARTALATAPAQAANIGPAVALYAQVQYGVTLNPGAVSPEVALRQAQISFEQAVAQYDQARQKVRLGTLQAYTEWQKAHALVTAAKSGLDRAKLQESQIRSAFAAGAVAKFDLLQAQAQVAGQQATLAGAEAYRDSALSGLEQVLGRRLSPDAAPASELAASADVTIPTDLDELTARALANRPDLRQSRLDVSTRRLQIDVVGRSGNGVVQLQTAAAQYELNVLKARAEVGQALEAAQSALEELKARETALEPARESLRLAELRYKEGLSTYLEVQSAFAGAGQAEAARIQSAAGLTLNLAKLALATGDL